MEEELKSGVEESSGGRVEEWGGGVEWRSRNVEE
jgi:hypothetical protein